MRVHTVRERQLESMQVAEGDTELHKLRKASEQLKREKEALQNDALQLTERTMELEHANRMLTNEVNEKKAARAKSAADGLSSPPPADGAQLPALRLGAICFMSRHVGPGNYTQIEGLRYFAGFAGSLQCPFM